MTRRLPYLAALALLLALAAGCGGSDTSDGGAAAGPPDSATDTSAPVSTTPAEPGTSTEPVSPETSEPTGKATADPGPGTTSAPEPTPTKAPPPSTEDIPRTYDDAVARFDAFGQEPQQLSRFESPTGNLYCVIDDPYIPPSCELRDGAISDPALCGDGPSQVVGRIEFSDGDPQPVCNSDTIREGGAPVLGYTAVAGWDGSTIQCLMETIGVTCINTAVPQGFFLAKGRYVIFTAG
ncbi:hypothetical protein BH11ACT8_BH11ACT8_27970 [soil metagenome]